MINLSLSSKSESLFAVFHDLADRAYFANVLLVCAANNVAVASYPVAVCVSDICRCPRRWRPGGVVPNPRPPVEFGAHGVDVDVAWKDGGRMIATGNSFAAPHIAAYATRIRAAHPDASPFEVKTILAATSIDTLRHPRRTTRHTTGTGAAEAATA